MPDNSAAVDSGVFLEIQKDANGLAEVILRAYKRQPKD